MKKAEFELVLRQKPKKVVVLKRFPYDKSQVEIQIYTCVQTLTMKKNEGELYLEEQKGYDEVRLFHEQDVAK